LLFGILALQNGFIDQSSLIAAFHVWTLDKKRALAQLLEERGALSASRRELLEALVTEHVRQHGDDPRQSLAALGSARGMRDDLLGGGASGGASRWPSSQSRRATENVESFS
jgi:hypothetical protein